MVTTGTKMSPRIPKMCQPMEPRLILGFEEMPCFESLNVIL